MPVAVIENGSRPNARAMRTLLTDLGEMIAREGVQSPGIIIIGEVAAMGLAENTLRALAGAAEAML